MTGTRVATERHDTALVLTLDGPDRLNAVTPTAMEALHTALGEAGRDPAIRAVILTGRGRAFCAGADLRDDLDPEATMRAANRVVETIRAVDVPVIAAVNGPAVGYGAALAPPPTSRSPPTTRTSCCRSRASAWCRTAAAPSPSRGPSAGRWPRRWP